MCSKPKLPANLTKEISKGRKTWWGEIDSLFKLVKENAGAQVNATKVTDNIQAVVGHSFSSPQILTAIIGFIIALAGLGRLIEGAIHALVVLWRGLVWSGRALLLFGRRSRILIWDGGWRNRRMIWRQVNGILWRFVRDLRIRFGNETLRQERERELEVAKREACHAEFWANVPEGTLGWSPEIEPWEATSKTHVREWWYQHHWHGLFEPEYVARHALQSWIRHRASLDWEIFAPECMVQSAMKAWLYERRQLTEWKPTIYEVMEAWVQEDIERDIEMEARSGCEMM